MINEGKLGRLINVTALWQLQKPDSYFETPWRREPGAGFLLTNLIHDLDLLRYLCGEVVQVQAFTRNDVRGFANEDSAAVLLQFANGALGSLTGSDAVAAPWSWELDAGESLCTRARMASRAICWPVPRSTEHSPAQALALRRGRLAGIRPCCKARKASPPARH